MLSTFGFAFFFFLSNLMLGKLKLKSFELIKSTSTHFAQLEKKTKEIYQQQQKDQIHASKIPSITSYAEVVVARDFQSNYQ
jgi:hypothetical protein